MLQAQLLSLLRYHDSVINHDLLVVYYNDLGIICFVLAFITIWTKLAEKWRFSSKRSCAVRSAFKRSLLVFWSKKHWKVHSRVLPILHPFAFSWMPMNSSRFRTAGFLIANQIAFTLLRNLSTLCENRYKNTVEWQIKVTLILT